MSTQDNFILTETTYDSFVVGTDGQNDFKMWQGLQGPYFIPSVDVDGNLSWTNTGGLSNPATVNISGPAGTDFEIAGIVENVSDLPASSRGVWLVGSNAPYDGYAQINEVWTYIGQFAIGPKGDPATIRVSSVVTLSPGSFATVTNSGTEYDVALNFGIPRGSRGPGILRVTTAPSAYTTRIGNVYPSYRILESIIKSQSGASDVFIGDIVEYTYYHYPVIYLSGGYAYLGGRTSIRGATGSTGPSSTVQVGDVITLSPGLPATVTNSGTASAAVFNFGIPMGASGAQGPAGEGVASGGTTGQILKKASGTDYDTEWTDETVEVLEGRLTAISGNGSTTVSFPGMKSSHVVVNWGLFTDSTCTTPIPENAPTCDITIETRANSYTITIANFTSSFYMMPTFGYAH